MYVDEKRGCLRVVMLPAALLLLFFTTLLTDIPAKMCVKQLYRNVVP